MAEQDLLEVGLYTIERWGVEQCDHYLAGLEECCQDLADHPGMGRSCDRVRKGYRRFEHESHVVFYLPEEDGVLVVSLHQDMVPERHLLDDE